MGKNEFKTRGKNLYLITLYKFQGLAACCRRRISKKKIKRPYRNTSARFQRWRRRQSSAAGRESNKALGRCHR